MTPSLLLRREKHGIFMILTGLLLKVAVSFTIPSFVTEYAPIIWLHSDDRFMPSDILTHVLHIAPWVNFDPIPEITTSLDLNNLSILNNYGKSGEDVFLTSLDDVSILPDWVLGETPDATGSLHNSTACAVVVVERTEADLDAFYFYFYSWNEGADIEQVLPPLNRLFPDSKPGDHFGNHLGDWEHNMIRFKNGKPTGIYFSQHTSGDACDWEDAACFSKQGDRPVVFSARGSHANYPTDGSHIHDEALIDVADKGRRWDPVSIAYFFKYDPPTDTFTAAEPGTDPTDWLHFTGAWGDKTFNDSDPRQKTVPYFGLKKFNNGPTGPKFKHLVRKGLKPDEREKPNLMKTLVHWYLGMYGCCLKGINPWVVVIFLLIALAAMVFLCVFTARKVGPRVKDWIMTKVNNRRQQSKEEAGSELHLRLLDPERAEAEDET